MSRDPIGENPFYILASNVTATSAEIEREGKKLLGLLTLGAASAREYVSPRGRHERTESDVRWAVAELRRPDRRLVHEVWATLPPEPVPPRAERLDGPWLGAIDLLGR